MRSEGVLIVSRGPRRLTCTIWHFLEHSGSCVLKDPGMVPLCYRLFTITLSYMYTYMCTCTCSCDCAPHARTVRYNYIIQKSRRGLSDQLRVHAENSVHYIYPLHVHVHVSAFYMVCSKLHVYLKFEVRVATHLCSLTFPSLFTYKYMYAVHVA